MLEPTVFRGLLNLAGESYMNYVAHRATLLTENVFTCINESQGITNLQMLATLVSYEISGSYA